MAEDGNRGASPFVATHGQTTEDSVALPYELLVHGILRMLDVADLLRCKLVCKQFRDAVDEDSHIQYTLELARTGHIDGPQQCCLSVPERLRRLKQQQNAWQELNFEVRPITLADSRDIQQWKFQSGVLVVAYLLHADLEDFDTHTAFDTLDIYFLESDAPYRRHTLSAPHSEFAIDAAQDLLVVWSDLHAALPTLCLEIMSLSSGTPHGRSFHQAISLSSVTEWTKDSIRIRGSVISVQHPPGTVVFDWTHQDPDSTVVNCGDGVLISENCLVRAGFDGGDAWITVLLLHRSPTQTLQITRLARFWLPSTYLPQENIKFLDWRTDQEYYMTSPRPKYTDCSVRCQVSASYERGHGESFPPSSPPPFSLSSDPAMLQITLGLWSGFVIMAYARPFLKVIDDYISLSPTENKAYRTKYIPWDEWGLKSTFWFNHSKNIFSKSTMYGYRVMTPTALYDFTPQGNGRAISDTERSQVVNGTDVYAWGLDVNPNTSMPFRVSELKGPDVQFGTYILGDELLAVKRTTGEKVFTLFAPQIDGSIGSRR